MEATNNAQTRREPNRRYSGRGGYRPDYGRPQKAPSWGEVPPEDLGDFICRVVNVGGCCILSRSTDGGVLSLTVIYGNDRWRVFPRSGDDALVAFRDILADLEP